MKALLLSPAEHVRLRDDLSRTLHRQPLQAKESGSLQRSSDTCGHLQLGPRHWLQLNVSQTTEVPRPRLGVDRGSCITDVDHVEKSWGRG